MRGVVTIERSVVSIRTLCKECFVSHSSHCFAIVAAVVASAGATSYAVPLVFQLDSALSSLSIDPSASPVPTTMQGAGSWTASYSGFVVADVTDTTIQLLPSTNLVAGVSGDWKPGLDYPTSGRAEDDLEYVNASAPANYGSIANLSAFGGPSASNSAIRDLRLSLSDASPKPIVGGAFSEAGMTAGFHSGVHYYSYGSAAPAGPISDLSGSGITIQSTVDSVGEATLVQSGNLLTMTLPVEFNVSYFVSNMIYRGAIVATAIVPEPLSIGLVLPAASSLLLTRRRRNVA